MGADALTGEATLVQPDFHDFYLREYPRLVAAMWAVSGDRNDAEDLAQEAFSRVLARWDQSQGWDDPSNYLFVVALNLQRRLHRRAAHLVQLLPRLLSPEIRQEEASAIVLVREALRRLPERHRLVLVFSEMLDLTSEEIAQLTRAKASTVRSTKREATQMLRKLLEDAEDV